MPRAAHRAATESVFGRLSVSLPPRPAIKSKGMGCAPSKNSADDSTGHDVNFVATAQSAALQAQAEEAAALEAEAAALEAEAAALEAKQAAKAKVATLLAAVHRGRADRIKVDNMKRPCAAYRVNMKGVNFGDCLCGWSKSEHTAEAFSAQTGASQKFNPLTSPELRCKFIQKEMAKCTRYVVNMQSINFGECSACAASKSLRPSLVFAS